jgi:predicted ATPase
MALHTGPAERRDNDYFGPTLNRVARLLAVAHGGQVLLSASAASGVETPNAEWGLLDLGLHRLKDLQQPEHVRQLAAPGVTPEFPPLRSLSLYRHNLPRQLTSFIGRERELAAVRELLKKTQLITLVGPGGCGKTRLGLQLAAELVDEYPDGVWLVELASLSDPEGVPQAVAGALGLREEPGQDLTRTLVRHLSDRRALVLLDNCEHLLTASASLAETLLRAAPGLRLLASSREPLGIGGETVYRVPSLLAPDPERPDAPDDLLQYESVRLFVDRARLQQPLFAVTEANAGGVARVCARLDGIPLALELAAARVRAMAVEKIDERLDDRFRLLTGGSRTALPRQQTLRALIDWSYDLLTEAERGVLQRLSVFGGGCTLEAAEQVCAGEELEEWEVLDLLTSLTDKSLVSFEDQEGEGRYRLLETVRQYSRDRLREAGPDAPTRRKHLAFFVALAEQAEPELTGPEQGAWLERLETEHENIRSALEFSLESRVTSEAGLRLVAALWRFWEIRGYLGAGQRQLAEALANGDPADRSPLRARALLGAATLALRQGDYDTAREGYTEVLALNRELGDPRAIANGLNNLGVVALHQRDPAARELFEECLALRRELGDPQMTAYTCHNLGMVLREQGDLAGAQLRLEECLECCRNLGDSRAVASTLNELGRVAQLQGEATKARELLEQSRELFQAQGNQGGMAMAATHLGELAAADGQLADARRHHQEALMLFREVGDRVGATGAEEALLKLDAAA